MSEIVKTQSKLAQPKTQKLNPKPTEEHEFDLADEMTSVAIAAADAPFAKAYETYEQRFSNNLRDFQTYVKGSQKRVSQMLKTEIYKVHGVDEAGMYGTDDE
ncbi:MAG: hypothetical protein KME10_23485 [Plectolyngbya sp. WJT66-NPBG17]|jgi:hypothetical protein|nr:hypothetical protein [Plectolyngbya sp. WJT66-NPBG17]